MRINELISKLKAIEKEYGNLHVEVRNYAGDLADASDAKLLLSYGELTHVEIES